ncbi:MAG: YajQ family cyclic di-GMP-binding protein [Vampirovibrionales bacterium]
MMMSKDNSFDIVSEFDHQELVNAVDQTKRDINTRFDLKDTGSSIEFIDGDKALELNAPDELKLGNILQMLEEKILKRGLSVFILKAEPMEDALGGRVKMKVLLQKGIDKDDAKKIVSEIKSAKLKVQASIQGDQVRVTGKSRDDLQQVISLLKEKAQNWSMPLQFQNFR